MLAADVFANQWEFLCSRFGKKPEPDEANEYFKYLRSRLDSDRFLKACQKIWAEYSRFPKPVDFVAEAPEPLALPPADDHVRDPYFRPVRRILKGSKAHRAFSEATRRRTESLPNDTGSPFYFPTPSVEVVDNEDEVGLYWLDCPTLRSLGPRGNG